MNSVWVNSTESDVLTANQNELKTSPSPFHNLSLTYRQRSLIERLTSCAYATRTVCEFKSITWCLCAFTKIYLLELSVILSHHFEFGYLISPSMPKSKRAKICICRVQVLKRENQNYSYGIIPGQIDMKGNIYPNLIFA